MEFIFRLTSGLAVIFLIITKPVYAQDSRQDYKDAHNAARAEVGVPPLEWDNKVANYAKQYAQKRAADCAAEHSGGYYGENIVVSDGDVTGVDAVKLWTDEKSNYDPNSNSCVGDMCMHYTQVVWSNSGLLGCAKVRCDNDGTFIVCNYDPPGNVEGERPF